MGYFRFALAALVMLSHLPGTAYKVNYGQMAVLGFYFISGYLMALIFSRFREKSERPIADFYIDRALKLWPAYAVVLLATFIFYNVTGIRHVMPWELAAEIFILPNAYGKLIWLPNNYLLIPPTWSLGVEAHFYLIVPVLAFMSYRAKIATAYGLTLMHLTVLTTGNNIGNFLPVFWPIRPTIDQLPISDYLGFDLPFLIVIVFLLGYLSYESFIVRKDNNPHLFIIWSLYAFSLFFLFPYKAWIRTLSANETLMGISLFIPIALALLVFTHHRPPGLLDRIFGSLSYPLFLTHWLSKEVVVYFFGAHAVNPRMILQSIVLSLVTAAALALLQRFYFDRLRYSTRGFGSTARRQSVASEKV